jgi:shikimate dehydrogenase
MEVTAEFLPSLLCSLRTRGFLGANVTIPHKQAIISFLDAIDPDAQAIGAVNTILHKGGVLTGFNTDVVGVRNALRPFATMIRGRSALVIGAGGGTRAVIASCVKDYAMDHITVYNRTPERAVELVASMGQRLPSCRYDTINGLQELPEAVAASSLIVNTTPIGMNSDASPLPRNISFSKNQLVFDVVYSPLQTTLMQQAHADGAQTIGGLEMLLHQGAEAFRIWTGKEFAMDVARTAVIQQLRTLS